MRFISLLLCTALAMGAAAPASDKKWSRDWKIYVITHTHADIGYTDLIPEVERVWAQGMDMAVAAGEKGLKWTLEGSLLFDAYARHRKPEKVRQLVDLVRKGSIEIASLYTNIEQENAGPEELIRASYYANETLRRQYGIESKTAMLSDITGLTWGLPRALSGTGTRYLLFGPGAYKELLGESKLPHLFWFKSPDGSRVLTQMRSGKYRDYTQAKIFLRPAAMQKGVEDLLTYYESMGAEYPYDAILLQMAFDNVNPQVELVDNINAWNRDHQNPHVYMATPKEFFEYVEKKFAAKIPEVSGDITSAWTDDPGIYAQATGMKRKAASEILSAEKFAAIDELAGTDRPYPRADINKTYSDMLVYTDHTYGMDNWYWEHLVMQRTKGVLHHPMLDYYKESWEDKKEFAYSAARASDQLLGNSVAGIAAKIPVDERTIVVFNPLSWARTDSVRVLHRALKIGRSDVYYDIVDNTTGERVPYQAVMGDHLQDTITFVARNVPPLGYKTYRLATLETKPVFAATAVSVAGNVLENEFYRVEMDPVSGGVSSIQDKELKRELVDRKAVEKVNQYLYYSLSGNHEALYQDNHPRTHLGRVPTSWYSIGIYSPMVAKVEVGLDGPAAKSLIADIQLDYGPAPSHITQEVILYPGIKRIDFVNRIHKQATLAKEEVYYAFPFDVPNFEINCELPGAVFQPHKDQLSGSFTGFSGIQHWADASNKDFGVSVATREVPAIEFGEIRTNEWDMQYQPKRPAFFFYIMNNKENTNGAFWQGSEDWRLGFFEVNFAVTSHQGGWREGKTTHFGWEHNTPLVARVLANKAESTIPGKMAYFTAKQAGTLPPKEASYSQGLPDHVILQALKMAEDGNGFVARFYETDGKAAEVAWMGPVKASGAQLCDMVERPTAPARVSEGRVEFRIEPWQVVTIRVKP
jgi:alpha-mannosidase